MAKCDHCHTRKGKRACPYLKGSICSNCCGENRGVHFDCPRDCPWFGPPAQAEAAGSPPSEPAAGVSAGTATAAPAPDFSRYQKFMSAGKHPLADLMGRIEIAIARYDLERRGLTDADVVQALEYLRRRASPIVAVERFAPELGHFLEKALAEAFRTGPAPNPYDLIEVLDHLLVTARNFGPGGSRLYLEQVGLLEARSREAREAGKEPGSAPPAGSRIILPR